MTQNERIGLEAMHVATVISQTMPDGLPFNHPLKELYWGLMSVFLDRTDKDKKPLDTFEKL